MTALAKGAPRTGLREAHAHIAQHGRAMTMERFAACAGLEQCLTQVGAAAARLKDAPRERWILGDGIRIEGWGEQRYPSAAELDEVSGERPVCIWSFDYHALVVNSAAMRALGISAAMRDPEHGRIVRGEDGRPTGVMIEAAAKWVWDSIPEPSEGEKREQVRGALRDLAGHGFTEIHDLLAPAWLGPVLAELDDAGELSQRVLLYPRVEQLAAVHAGKGAWERERVKLAGGKLFADGTLNSRTAWMLEPYEDPLPGLPCGQRMASDGEIRGAMELTRGLGMELAVHAIGDAAVRGVLDAWEAVGGERSESLGLRVEHAELIDEADVRRFAGLGVVCSVQPCHLLSDIEALKRGVPRRLERVLPLRELIDAGCRPGELLWFGSDTPIVRPDPGDSIYAATMRRREGSADAVGAGQAISEGEAWGAFNARS